MLKKLSIRNKLIIYMLIGCLVPFLIGSFYIKNKTEEGLYNRSIEQTNLLIRQIAEHVDDSILENMHNLISIMAMDERFLNVDSNINSYLNFDSNTFVYQATESETEIMEYLHSIKKNQEMLNLISFGTEEGKYIEYPSFKPTGPYDPRERGWYSSAINQEDAVISEPYLTKMSKELVISVSKSVIKNDKKIGVLCLTIKLDDLGKDMNGLIFSKTGYILVLDPNNNILNSPLHEEWKLHSTEELGLDIFSTVDYQNGKSFEGQIDGVDKVFNVYISPYSGWKYISVIDKSEILEGSTELTEYLIVVFLFILLIIVVITFLISIYITEPILDIAHVIKKMATFKFDIYEHKNIKSYTKQQDEIGEISRALNSMQTNYMELKNNIAIMDYEIKNININEVSYELKLSEDNPFSGIANSINDLLKKVHSSFEEINFHKEYISFLADHDPLTNLPNRRYIHDKFNQLLNDNGKGAVLLLDLDNFKGINDTLGHLFGDKVLQYISHILEQVSNEGVFVCRFGGDEFLILYNCKDKMEEILHFTEHFFELFNKPFLIDQNEVKIEFSMGISIFPNDSLDINQLIMNADLALYNAKNNGKNSFVLYNNKMAEHLKYKLIIKAILKEAIVNNGFKLLYQPQVNIKTGEITGYEALIRLKNHNISPSDFIPIAEDDDTIIKVGRIVTKMVVEQLHNWQMIGLNPKPVSINFSAVQMHDYNYKTFLLELLKEYNVNPDHIVIEITENIFLENKETTITFLDELRAQGIKIAVDDFGTGYSSLSYLTFLPIDMIKLDRALSYKFLELDSITVMDSLIALAHSLNLKVIAEGIEEFEQVKRLIVGKCDEVQGNYFSEPLEVEELVETFDRIYETFNVKKE